MYTWERPEAPYPGTARLVRVFFVKPHPPSPGQVDHWLVDKFAYPIFLAALPLFLFKQFVNVIQLVDAAKAVASMDQKKE